MKKIFAIAWKDAIIRFSGKTELLFFIILPVFFTVILAGGTGAPADQRVRLLVTDEANSPLSAQLVQALTASDAVRPDTLSAAAAEAELKNRSAAAWLIIPAGFDGAALQGGTAALDLRQLPNNLNALAAERAVQSVVRRLGSAVQIASGAAQAAEARRPFENAQARQQYFDAALSAAQSRLDAAPQRVSETVATVKDEIEYDPRANSSAGQLITWVFIPLLGISGLFAYERTQGTLRRLLTTPTGKTVFLLGAITGQSLIALVQMLLLVGFGSLVMGLNWAREPLGLVVMLVSSVLAAAAMGVALGAFVKTEGQASNLSIMLGMVMALMGGCMYPLEMFPEFVRGIVRVLPTTWAMQGMLDLLVRGGGAADVLPEAAVLLGFAALFLGVGVWRFRYE